MKLPFSTDKGFATKAALGLIVLESDETLEAELRSIFDIDGVALHHSRIANAPEITPETLKEMERELPRATKLLPRVYPLDVVGYGCTSGATVIGPDRIADIINSVHPKAKITNPISAVMAALAHLNVNKIGMVTPYVMEVSTAMIALLEDNGFSIAVFGTFEESADAQVARITTASVYDAICAIGDSSDVEAIFVSCTNLRSFDILEQAEATIGKPVVSSNQALAWHMLKLAGIESAKGPGKLFRN